MRARTALSAVVAVVVLAPAGQALAGISAGFLHDPGQPYLSQADSPFASLMNNDAYDFYLEDFEDGELNSPGLSAAYQGAVLGTGFAYPEQADSVDGDDGVLDGSGLAGHSLFVYAAAPRIVINFDADELGGLPTHAGLVWTDGTATDLIEFEAWDGDGLSLGSIQATNLGSVLNPHGTASEDRFFGISNLTGISAISLSRVGGLSGFEIDHIQYGLPATVPGPGSAALLATAFALAGVRRRRRV